MKRTFTTSTLMLLTATLMLLPATLSAQPASQAPGAVPSLRGPYGPGGGPGRGGGELFLHRMAEALELSKGQIAEIEALMSNHRIQTAQLRAEARAAHEAVQEVAESTVFDEASIRAAGQKVAAVEVELTVERARLKSEIHTVLTPEQQEKAAELKAERQIRRREFGAQRGQRGGRGPRGRAPQARRW